MTTILRAASGATAVHGSGRRARERALRRTEVLAAARQLFARKGYQRTTMVEIAAASELALGTLYQLFASKEAILCSLLEGAIDELIARVGGAVAEPAPAAVRLQRAIRTHLAFARDNVDVVRLYLSGWTGYEFTVRQRFGERIDTKYEQYLAVLTGVFRRGMREGAFIVAPPRRLAVMVAGMILGIIRRSLREKTLNMAVEGEALAQVILRGVARDGNGGRR